MTFLLYLSMVTGGCSAAHFPTDDSVQFRSANEVLEFHENLLRSAPPLKMEVQVEIRGVGIRLGLLAGRNRYQLSIRQSKNLLDVHGRGYFIDWNDTVLENSVELIHQRVLGSLILVNQIGPTGSPIVLMDSNAPEAFKKLHFDGRCGWMLDGSFYGSNNRSVVELLKSAKTLQVVPDPDHQNLIHIQGSSNFGLAEGWFDPKKQYLLVGYRITKVSQDQFDQSTLLKAPGPISSPTNVGWQVELSDVETVEVNGFPIVACGNATLTLVDAVGEKNAIIYSIKRSGIQVDTEPNALTSIDSFISEGSEIYNKQQPGIKYSYVNHEVRPTADLSAIRQIDALLDKYQATGRHELDLSESNFKLEPNTYCGLYCLYARAKLAKLKVQFDSLLRPEFAGSAEGTSIGELALAAKSLDLDAQIYSDLTPQQLQESPLPLILNVHQTSKSVTPDHYVLLLEVHGETAIVFDPPNELRGPRIRAIPLPVLAAQWSRAAIATSPPNMAVSKENAITNRAIIVALGASVALLLLIIVNRFMRPLNNSKLRYYARLPIQVAIIVLASLAAATVFGMVVSDGIRLDEVGRQAAQLLYQRRYPSVLNVSQLTLLKRNESVIFIDARENQGSSLIPRALHIPFNSSVSLRMQNLAGIDKSTRIITYCEPYGCPIAGRLALLLEDDGFTSVQVLEGDWRPYANSVVE